MSGTPAAERPPTATLLFACLFPTLAAWAYFLLIPGGPAMRVLYAGCKAVQFGFPLLWAARAGRFPSPPGPRRPGVWPGLISGAALGLCIAAAYALARSSPPIVDAAPRVTARLQAIGAATPLRFLALAAFFVVMHSFLEEYYWRGFVHGLLRERLARVPALGLSSAAFMSHHAVVLYALLGGTSAAVTALLSVAVAVVGAGWAWLYERHGSLAPPWLSHLLTDAAIFAVAYDLVRPLQ